MNIKSTFLFFYKTIYRLVYFFLKIIKPIKKNKVVISIYRGDKLEGNLLYIYNELIKLYPEMQIKFIKSSNKFDLRLFKTLIEICDAKYILLDDYFLPIYIIKPKKEVKIIQLWHAAGAFKKFGYSTIGKRFSADTHYLKIVPIHMNYTHVYVSSGNIVQHYAEAFNMSSDRIFPMGIPRSDFFFDDQLKLDTNNKIKQKYHKQMANKTIVLFAPTYRTANNKQQESKIDHIEILNRSIEKLDKDKLIILKLHPYFKSDIRLEDMKNVLIADNEFNLNEWMLVSDALITDYSSSVFEYALLEKPMAHFVPDLKEYEKNRGLYYPIKTISDASILENVDDLIEWINCRKKNEYLNTEKMVSFNFNHLRDVSKKIVLHFINE